MKVYRNSTIATLIITLLSLGAYFVFAFVEQIPSNDIWANIFVGIFTGALLSFITSLIQYLCERRKTLIALCSHAKEFRNMAIEHFYMNYDFDVYEHFRKLNDIRTFYNTAYCVAISNLYFFVKGKLAKFIWHELDNNIFELMKLLIAIQDKCVAAIKDHTGLITGDENGKVIAELYNELNKSEFNKNFNDGFELITRFEKLIKLKILNVDTLKSEPLHK